MWGKTLQRRCRSGQLCRGVGATCQDVEWRDQGFSSALSFLRMTSPRHFPSLGLRLLIWGGSIPNLDICLQTLRFWDSLDFALNPVFMTLVSPETLWGTRPSCGRRQWKTSSQTEGAGSRKEPWTMCHQGSWFSVFLAAWQVAGNVGHARSMVIGKCEARSKPERVCPT